MSAAPIIRPPLRGQWRENRPMARLSTWGVGGAARTVFWPADLADLARFVGLHRGERFHLIGLGSNILVRDGGVDGVVVRTAPGLAKIRQTADGAVYAEAGVACARLARFCAARGLGGGGFFCGIPGTVGGALFMNAGCFGGQTWDAVERVAVIGRDGVMREKPASSFCPGYRRVRPRALFGAAYFRFRDGGDSGALRAEIADLLRRRKAEQPIGAASAGSVFRNPPGDYAARLIEKCGLKGARAGGAAVSAKHANFIVADKGATAADIERLIGRVRRVVRARTGVGLAAEVGVIGEKQ